LARIIKKGLLIISALLLLPVFALDLPGTLTGKEVYGAAGIQEDYNKETLFKYINGGADVYINAGFVKCSARKYVEKKSKLELVVNVYDMGTLLQAFGLFRELHGRSEIISGVGVEASSSMRRFCFWKDLYYVEVVDKSKTLADVSVLRNCAQATAKLITEEAVMPYELSWFPEPQKIKESERFHKTGFLGRKFLKDVFSCEYRVGDNIFRLFIVLPSYGTNTSEMLKQLQKAYPDQKKFSSASRLKGMSGIYTDEIMAVSRGNLLIGVVGPDDEMYKAALIENSLKKVTVL
jgi:hypothetical protein